MRERQAHWLKEEPPRIYAGECQDNAFFAVSGATAPLNYVWLRTSDDPNAIASVRRALASTTLQLSPLSDRRADIIKLGSEPLYIELIGILTLGAIVALLLALVGNLIASWLSARSRLTNFAVLRALGAAPPQVAGALTWEQSIIYFTAIVLGIGAGALLSWLVIPSLVFTSVSQTATGADITPGAFYILQNSPPTQLVLPPSLWIALGVLIIICVIAIGMMVRIVSRPSVSQTLRLNED